jgi:hypothetical protein
MLSALKIALVVLAVLVLVVCGIVLWLLKVIRQAVKTAMASAPQPCRVTLEPEPNPQWLKPEIITGYAKELRALGFEDVGAFRIPEMRGLLILGLVHPGEGLLSVVYDHNKAPKPTFDICADFTDGSTISATNSAAGSELDRQPNHPILWLGEVGAGKILEAVQKFPAPAPRQSISKKDFVGHFKTAYARSINWRLKKGGASRDEIRRQAEKKGKPLTDEQLETSYQNLHQKYLQQLQAGCIAQYLDDQKPAAAEWERIQTRTFAIAETLELKEIIEIISGNVELDEAQQQQLGKVQKNSGEDAIAVMERILDQNIATLGLKKIGGVTEPVRALIMLAPEEPEESEPVDIPATVVK